MAKNTDNLIHLRFDYSQAKDAKKDLLNSQICLLKIGQAIKNYKALRIKELNKKESIAIRLKNVKSDISKLKKSLPKIILPKILKKEDLPENPTEHEMEIAKKVTKYGTIEDQLRQIQAKLKELEEH